MQAFFFFLILAMPTLYGCTSFDAIGNPKSILRKLRGGFRLGRIVAFAIEGRCHPPRHPLASAKQKCGGRNRLCQRTGLFSHSSPQRPYRPESAQVVAAQAMRLT